MPMVPIWKNGQFLGTQWVAPKRKPLPPLTGGRGQPPGGGGYFPKPGPTWGIRGGKDPYLVDRMVNFRPAAVDGGGGGATAPAPVLPPAAPPTTGGTTTAPPPGGAAPTGDPWDAYLAKLDERERAAYAERIRLQQESARNYLEALGGFGQALQGNAAEQWGNVIKAYGRAGDTATAFGEGLASSYGQGLTDANRQIAADFAAIGQGGPADIRSDEAALEQIRTQGGERPGEMAGLVGRAWGSYGETRPGSIGFMTGQNQMQVTREALQLEQETRAEMAQAMADNPQQAMSMWATYEEWKNSKTKAEADAKAAELQFELEKAKNAREERALGLQESTIQRQWAQALEDMAWNRTNATGTLWVVGKNGKLVNTGRRAPGSAAGKAATQAATTRYGTNVRAATAAASLAARVAQDNARNAIANAKLGISQQQANAATKRAGDYGAWLDWKKKHPNAGKNKKGPGGLSEAQVRQYASRAAGLARAFYRGDEKNGIAKQGPNAALHQMLSFNIPYQIAWKAIYQYAKLSNKDDPGQAAKWKLALKWNPGYKAPSKKKKR